MCPDLHLFPGPRVYSSTKSRSRSKKVAQRRPSTNPPPTATPEVYFRILYTTPPHGKRSQPEYRLTVEVALGPWRAFENGNIGRLERVVPPERLVTVVPLPRRSSVPSRPRKPPKPKSPRIVETLLKARQWRRQIDAGEVADQATIARRKGLSRARVTQVLMLLRLAPDIQEAILSLPQSPNPPRISEMALRPITRLQDPQGQMAAFEDVVGNRP